MESFEGGGGRGVEGGRASPENEFARWRGEGEGEQSLGNLGNDERLIFHGEVR